jgi:molecular chaperone DnaK (HSP70)
MQETKTEKMETATRESESVQTIYWGYLESKDVLDTNGEYVGVLRGILIADNWTIPEVVIEVNEDVLDEMGVETPLFSDALVNLPSRYVRNGSDVVQLTENVASLKEAAKPYFLTKKQAKARAQEAEKQAVTKVKEAREKARADAHQMSEKTKKAVQEAREKAKADAHQMSEKAKKAAQEAREKAKADAHQANEKAKTTLQETKEKVKEKMQEAREKN